MNQLGISSNIEFSTECADYRTDSDFHELLPLSYVSFLMATSTDRSIPGHPLGPFPQRQRFRQSGAVAASPYACHSTCRPIRGCYTSDFFPQRQHFPRLSAVAASPYACHPSCRPLRGRCTSDFFPQRQRFPRLSAVAASPYACHPTCRPLRGRCTSDFFPQRQRFPRLSAVAV